MSRSAAQDRPSRKTDAWPLAREIDLIPTQVYELGRPQAVAEGDKDHGGIPVTPAIGLGGIDHPIDLGAGQVLPSPIDQVRFSSRHSDCSIYGGWCHQFQR